MQDKLIYINGNLAGLNPKSCGYHTAYESSDAIPAVAAFTSLHYVASGKGTLTKTNKVFSLKEGDIFIIKKGEDALCSPDPDSTLSYYFISFDGILASDIEALPTVFAGEKRIFEKISEIEDTSPKSISLLSAYLFEIYSKYYTYEKNSPNDYVEKIKNYIELNYQNDIRIENISSILHLSRAYIARIFKKRMGMTVTEYMNIYRLKQAEQYLANGKSITETAYLCGFADLSNFSKKFKNILAFLRENINRQARSIMINCEYIFNCNYPDLNPRYFGKTKAKKEDETSRRAFKDSGMIHFVENGSGTVIKNGKEYKVSAGDVFVFSIGDLVSYTADASDLWTVVYIGFDGTLCEDFKRFPDIFRDENIFLKNFEKIASYNGNKAALLASYLLKLHSSIVSEKNPPQNDYVKFTKTYIKENYMKDISVEGIASMLGISRFHLSHIFKQETTMTVQEYLITKRVHAGKKFIESGKSIKEAAYLSGFGSAVSFSRCYKKLYNIQPYKRKNEITQNIKIKDK